jgi:hypothetical protein
MVRYFVEVRTAGYSLAELEDGWKVEYSREHSLSLVYLVFVAVDDLCSKLTNVMILRMTSQILWRSSPADFHRTLVPHTERVTEI